MKPLAIILCVAALFAYAEESIAERQARHEKARAELKAQLDAIQAENRKAMNARRNTNGTFTVSGPVSLEDNPDCRQMSLTFTSPTIRKGTNCTTRAHTRGHALRKKSTE